MTDVALFGAGRIGKIHAGNVVRQPGVRLKYVVDVDSVAATALAAFPPSAEAQTAQPAASGESRGVRFDGGRGLRERAHGFTFGGEGCDRRASRWRSGCRL